MHKGHVEKLEKAIELTFEVERDARGEMETSEYIAYRCFQARRELDISLSSVKEQIKKRGIGKIT